ncbi:MAG: glycosyltransferase family 4 protein [Candidatus Diapherotrites archaeon]
MKILMHYNGVYSETAGVSRVVLGLGKALQKKGVGIEFLYGYSAPKGMHSYLNALKGFFHFLHHTPITLFFFAGFVKGKNFDVVHSHTPEAAFDAVMARFFLRKKYKVVVHLHGLDKAVREEWKKEIKSGRIKYCLKTGLYLSASIFKAWFAMKMADSFIAVSHAVQKEAEKFYGVQAKVVPNAVDCSEFKKIPKNQARKDLSFKEKDFIVLFVGNAGWVKGLHYLAEAFSVLKDAKLLIVGLEKKEFDLNFLSERVYFAGHVKHSELSKYYSVADVLCVPSIYEAFGLMFAEAQCFGLHCIGCNGTGAEETIVDGKNGFLVEKRNVLQLRQAIEKSKDYFSKKANEGNTLSAAKSLSWKKNANRVLRICRELVNGAKK